MRKHRILTVFLSVTCLQMWMNVWITLEWRRTCAQMDNVKTLWRITSVFVMLASGVMSLRNYATVRKEIMCSRRQILYQPSVFHRTLRTARKQADDRHTHTTDRQQNRQSASQTVDSHADRQTYKQTGSLASGRQADRHRQADRQTDRQADRQTGRQTAKNLEAR